MLIGNDSGESTSWQTPESYTLKYRGAGTKKQQRNFKKSNRIAISAEGAEAAKTTTTFYRKVKTNNKKNMNIIKKKTTTNMSDL